MATHTPFRSPRHTRAIVVADWHDAEELARWHMREVLGFADTELTPRGADGGIDVVSSHALAQVKHYTTPVGSPEVQQHAGAAHRCTARRTPRARSPGSSRLIRLRRQGPPESLQVLGDNRSSRSKTANTKVRDAPLAPV